MSSYFKSLKLALLAMLVLTVAPAWGQESAPSPVTMELQALIQDLGPRLQNTQGTPEFLRAELPKFDALYAKYADQKTEDVARVLVMKAMLSMEFLNEPEIAIAAFKKLENDFAGTDIEGRARAALAKVEIQTQLKEGNTFPSFEVTDLSGDSLKLEDYRGQVVLLDFWATWCGPCVSELPNVLDTYQAYHDKGFQIIGISLDKSREKLDSFIREHNMDWPQFFDGKGWENSLAQTYGIQSIPATFLIDKNGVIIGSGLRGGELKAAVAKALGEE